MAPLPGGPPEDVGLILGRGGPVGVGGGGSVCESVGDDAASH